MHRKCIYINKDNEEIHIEAVYEDSMPNGSNVGTVIGFHGAPGSNRDFKYIRETLDILEIRFIGINYPGFGITKSYENQKFTNEERQLFTNSLLDSLSIKGKIVFVAHSRGCENALISVIEKQENMNILGLVLIAPTGLRPHQAIRSKFGLVVLDTISNYLPTFARDALLIKTFEAFGLRVASGEIAHASLKTSMTLDLENLLPHIQKFNEISTKLVVFYGGKDQIIEKEIVTEYLSNFKDHATFNFDDDILDEHFQEITTAISEHKTLSVLVDQDGHYQNKSRANIIARSIQLIFK
ncbi:unnamed protein product [Caenorhabditis angaria]|uniref:AB hydrolase-1 domain-containing protein n=1 Tax=Caenorhabditis angaria TaxID=860376 RepID=A0A9P1IW35_9PELO|nr:unnamed protein product [Caenorhabditis angaria]